MREFSCEHCGRPEERQAPRACDHCRGSMCFDCTEEHDTAGVCPNSPARAYDGERGYPGGALPTEGE